jgi:hypothetical protein
MLHEIENCCKGVINSVTWTELYGHALVIEKLKNHHIKLQNINFYI